MTDLGSCCICETRVGVTNVMMIDRRGPVPGTGWGCVVCDLPADGAVAVLCDGCLELARAGAVPIFVCAGYAGDGKRVHFADLPADTFTHDQSKHQDEGK